MNKSNEKVAVKTISYELGYLAGYTETKVDALKEKLMENFCYHLPWSGEEIWKYQFKLESYKFILKMIENEKIDSDEEVLNSWLKEAKSFLSRPYNVRENSTGSLHREISTWKFITTMELVAELESLLKS